MYIEIRYNFDAHTRTNTNAHAHTHTHTVTHFCTNTIADKAGSVGTLPQNLITRIFLHILREIQLDFRF